MLTMALVSDVLSEFDPVETITDGNTLLSGVRIGAECPKDCISVFEEGGSVVCRNGGDSVVVGGVGVAEVANRLLEELDLMNAFEMNLARAQTSDTLSGIIGVGASMLDAPMLVVDTKSMMCSMSDASGETDDASPVQSLAELRYARLNGRLPWNALEFVDREMVFASQLLSSQGKPFAAEVFGREAEAAVCRIESGDGEMSAFLFAFMPVEEATGGKLQVVEMVANGIREWIDSHEGEQRMFSKIDLLARLAEGDEVSDAEIAEGRRQMGPHGEYVLARVLHSRDVSHAWVAAKIQEGVEGSRCFEFHDVLFALCPGDNVVAALERIADAYEIRFGLSWKFADWRMIAEAVDQTDIALFYTADKVAVLDSHCMMFYIFTQLTASMGGIEIMHPAIETLLAHDAGRSTEYARTLWVYLRHERNLVGTSEDLGIHRNSLIYRIKRIEEMIPDVDLDDPEVREHLMMSYRIRGLRSRSGEEDDFGIVGF